MNGILIIDKPKGYTSHDIVNIVRKKLNIKKVGHTGTLDPNATGVLPILIGQATKLSKYLIEHDKTYIATLKLGEKTDTGDTEGKIIETDYKIRNFTEDQLKDILKNFIGKQEQMPPIYSAIKINGKKAYEYARQNQIVEIRPREINIYNINLIKFNEDEITFEVQCSKGTYIRTLCEDIAKKLNTVGFMKELQRTEVNNFRIKEAIQLNDLCEEKIISIEDVFKDKEKVNLNNKELEMFLNGMRLKYKLIDDVYKIYNNKQFIGLGVIKDEILKRDIII